MNLSSYESRILWFVLRKTYGYGKKIDRISRSQFSEGTGIKAQHISRAVKSLVDRQILIRDEPTHQFVLYGIQKNYEIWKPAPIKGDTIKGVPNEGVPIEDQTCIYIGSKPAPIKGDTIDRKKTKDRVRAEKRTPASRAAKEADPTIKQFIDFWHQEYLDRFENKYVFTGKDGALVKRLLGSYQVDQLKSLAISFFETGDSWIKTNGGFTLGVFSSQINKIISTTKASNTRPVKEMPL